jgi:hypothetical protein
MHWLKPISLLGALRFRTWYLLNTKMAPSWRTENSTFDTHRAFSIDLGMADDTNEAIELGYQAREAPRATGCSRQPATCAIIFGFLLPTSP